MAMRFSTILLAYFVIGSTMWAGGVISWDNAGLGQVIIEEPGTGSGQTQVNESTSSDISNMGGPIGTAAGAFGGGLVTVWNIMVKFIGFLFWPITALMSVNAPPRVVVLLGGSTVMAFVGGILRTVRSSS